VVSNVGSDAITLSGLLEAYAKQGGAKVNGNQLINGIITDGIRAAGAGEWHTGTLTSHRPSPTESRDQPI
jgi:hypothetical protein